MTDQNNEIPEVKPDQPKPHPDHPEHKPPEPPLAHHHDPMKPQFQEERLLHHNKGRKLSFGRLLFGSLFILIGLAYLANSTGLIEINLNFWQLWPLLIIIFGLSIISSKGWVSWVVGIIVTIAVLSLAAWIIFSGTNTRSVTTEDIDITKSESVTQAEVTFKTGAGSLVIKGDGMGVVSGTHETNGPSLSTSTEVEDEIQKIGLTTSGSWQGLGNLTNELDLNFSNDLFYQLSIDSGAMGMDLDFSKVQLTNLDIDTGASSLDLVLGDKVDQADVSIEAGASSLDITVPKEVGVKVNIDAGLSSKNLDDLEKVDDNTYQSEGYDEAEKKVDIDLDIGVSSLTIRWE
ncbi:MAG: DUF5668 domain-containing protein [Patescibacteria group bacterium]